MLEIQTASVWRFFLNFSNIAHDRIFCINTFSDHQLTLVSYDSNVTHNFSEKNMNIFSPQLNYYVRISISKKLFSIPQMIVTLHKMLTCKKKFISEKKFFLQIFFKNFSCNCCGFVLQFYIAIAVENLNHKAEYGDIVRVLNSICFFPKWSWGGQLAGYTLMYFQHIR